MFWGICHKKSSSSFGTDWNWFKTGSHLAIGSIFTGMPPRRACGAYYMRPAGILEFTEKRNRLPARDQHDVIGTGEKLRKMR